MATKPGQFGPCPHCRMYWQGEAVYNEHLRTCPSRRNRIAPSLKQWYDTRPNRAGHAIKLLLKPSVLGGFIEPLWEETGLAFEPIENYGQYEYSRDTIVLQLDIVHTAPQGPLVAILAHEIWHAVEYKRQGGAPPSVAKNLEQEMEACTLEAAVWDQHAIKDKSGEANRELYDDKYSNHCRAVHKAWQEGRLQQYVLANRTWQQTYMGGTLPNY